jgi:uncharacterized protein YcfL
MRNLLLTFLLLFSFSGCNDDKQQTIDNAKIAQEAKAEKEALLAEIKAKDEALQKARRETKIVQEKLIAQEQAKKKAFLKEQSQKEKELKQTKQNEKLSKVGISIKENTITIDTNKTKDFFQNIGKKLGDKLKKITEDIQKGMIEEKDAGVKIDETHINIDLNKTKDFLEAWGKKMQGFVKEFDDMAKEMGRETKPLENNHVKGN